MSKNNIESIYPLQPAQQGMLLETVAAPGSGLHIEQMLCALRGALDYEAFDLARKQIVQRQPVLRTGFIWKDQDEPLQFVASKAEAAFLQEDWRGLDDAAQQEKLGAYLDADRRAGFQLGKPPLMRLALFKLGDDLHQLVWTHHHILIDGWSLSLLFKEFVELYKAYSSDLTPQLAPPSEYRDYIKWLKQQDLKKAETFWSKTLGGITQPTPLGIPCSPHPLPDGQDRFGEQKAYLSYEASASLQALAKSKRLTVNTPVQAAWALLLHCYSGQRDVVFGATVSGRPPDLPGVETMIGVFINTLPVRLQVSPQSTLDEWLQQIQEFNLELRQYEHTPGDKLSEWSGAPDSMPLYESIIVYENYPVDGASLEGATFSIEIGSAQLKGARTKYALTFLVVAGERLLVHLVYDQTRIDSKDAGRILEHFISALENIASDSQQPLAGLLARIPEDQKPHVAPWRKRKPLEGRAKYAPPRNSTEELIAAAWSQALGDERVGIHDNFFELGGHSLVALQLTATLSQALQIQLPLRSLFDMPTVASLATEVARLKRSDYAEQSQAAKLPTILPAPEDWRKPFPLTDVQQAYWVGRKGDFELGNVATHVYLEIDSPSLDIERFNEAWQKVINRHQMLRAIILPDGQQQILEQTPPFRIEKVDLTGLAPESVARALQATRDEMSHRVLPSDRWPLFECCASVMDDGHVRLHIGYDMLITDAWSFRIISRELAHFYHYPDSPLPPLTLSFRDYVIAEASLKETEIYRRSWDYWQNCIRLLPPAPDLPIAINPAALKQPRFTRCRDFIEPQTWKRLKARAIRAGITPSAFLLTAFAQALTAWSKNRQFTINLTLFNRMPLHPQVNEVVGDFTTLTLLAVDHSTPESFEDAARRLQDRLWMDLDHRYFSAVRVMRELVRLRGGGARALMPVVFTSTLAINSGTQDDDSLALPGEVTYGSGQTPQVWLDCQVSERQGQLAFWWDAVEELFPAGMLQDMFEAYGRMLHRLAEDEQAWTNSYHDLTPDWQLRRRAEVNATAAPTPAGLLQTRFIEQARRRPSATAIISTARSLSYDELYRRSNHIGRRLREAGAKPNELVAVVMQKGWEQVVAVLGILQAGAAYLPIDAGLPSERIRFLLSHGEARFVLTQSGLEKQLDFHLNVKLMVVGSEPIADAADAPLEAVQRPEDIAYVIYTSGSTGLPKGVVIDHRGALNTIVDINERFAASENDRVLALSSLSFDLSVYDIFGALSAGGTIILPDAMPAPEPSHWAHLLDSYRVTIWNSVPALMEMTVSYLNGKQARLPDSLRLVMLSGDWIPLQLPTQIKAHAPEVAIISLGGATEASIWSILYPVTAIDPTWTSVPYGKPMVNQSFEVLNAALEPCPIWVPGELFIGGIGLAKGYWRDEAKTNASFIIHPRTGQRLYRTGDMGRFLPDGNIEFLGREDFQVKIQGFRIEMGEIEAALAQHPAVGASVVVAIGERHANKHLVAYVLPAQAAAALAEDSAPHGVQPPGPPAPLQEAELRAFLNERLPKYMIPSAFVTIDRLPLTANGKVDRKALPAPGLAQLARQETIIPPRTPVEATLARFWATALATPRIGVRDDFFELGGDSIIAARLITVLRDAFRVEMPIRLLFEHPTVEGLARQIEDRQKDADWAGESHIAVIARDDSLPLSYSQQRLWFQDRLAPGNPAYNVPLALRLCGALDIGALTRALDEIVKRHEILRSNFETVGGQPRQRISPAWNLRVPMIDLKHLPEAERLSQARGVASAEARKPFDLSNDRLIRVTLLRLGVREHLLLLTMHHIVCDAWSLGILSEEVSALYEAFTNGGAPALADPPVQYVDYAAWQRNWLQGDVMAGHLDYWIKQLDNCTPLKLPTQRRRSKSLTFSSASQSQMMAAEVTQEIRHLCRREGASLFMILLSAFKTLLYGYTGQEDIVVGTSIAGRTRREAEKLIGCFVNLLALRTQMGSNPTFRGLIARVRDITLNAYLHQELPFEKVIEAIQPERSPGSQTPLFGALFVLENAPAPIVELPDLTLQPFDNQFEIARHDLNFHTMETEEGLRAIIHYNTELFDDGEIVEILQDYQMILVKGLREPDTKLNELAKVIHDRQRQRRSQELKERKKANFESLPKKTQRIIN